MQPTFLHLALTLPYYLYALILLFLAKVFYQKTSNFPFARTLVQEDNPAFGVCFGGYLVGVALALSATFPADRTSFGDGLFGMTYCGILAIVLMRLSLWVNAKLVLDRLNVQEELVHDRNVGAGLAVAGSSLASGLMLAGALTGESVSVVAAIRDLIVYWVAGQALLVAGARIFELTAGYDVEKSLGHDDNSAAGMNVAGFLTALGIILWAALRNATSNILIELAITAIVAVVGGALLLVSGVVTARVLLSRVNLAREIAVEKNTAAGFVSAATMIVTAVLLAAAILSR